MAPHIGQRREESSRQERFHVQFLWPRRYGGLDDADAHRRARRRAHAADSRLLRRYRAGHILAVVIWTGLAVLTLGLSAFLLPPIYPLVAFFYNGLCVSGRRMATPGMRAMDARDADDANRARGSRSSMRPHRRCCST